MKTNISTCVTTLPMPGDMTRVETGPVQFGDDWVGVFLRGDDAAVYAKAIEALALHDKTDPMALLDLGGLWKILQTCKQVRVDMESE